MVVIEVFRILLDPILYFEYLIDIKSGMEVVGFEFK